MRRFTTIDGLAILAVAIAVFVLCLPLLLRLWSNAQPVVVIENVGPLPQLIVGQSMNDNSELILTPAQLPRRNTSANTEPVSRDVKWRPHPEQP